MGLLLGAILAYTSRFYINGDAIAYVEMGEALRNGYWPGLVNLTYSPGYPILLGAAQRLLDTNPMNELQLLRVVSFINLVLAMGACDLLMGLVKQEIPRLSNGDAKPLPEPILSALCYSFFLVAALIWVRMRLLNPDMLILCLVTLCTAAVLWIRQNPSRLSRFALLGLAVGVGYIVKSFFLVFSPVLFGMAALCSRSVKRAVIGTVLAATVTILVAAPLIGALSDRLGRFTYGELGGLAYAQFISGKGEPFRPKLLNETPKLFLYRWDRPSTRPAGIDICYWLEGFGPDFNASLQFRKVLWNVAAVFDQSPWLGFLLLWFLYLWRIGGVKLGTILPPSPALAVGLIGLAGMGFYCLIHIETRYTASFLFLIFLAMCLLLRSRPEDPRWGEKMRTASLILVGMFVALLAHTTVDQSLGGLRSTDRKPSYREAFQRQLRVSDYLKQNGLHAGSEVAMVGSLPVQWARIAGAVVVAEVPDVDSYFSASAQARRDLAGALAKEGIGVLVGKGAAFSGLADEGWNAVPGAGDWHALRP